MAIFVFACALAFSPAILGLARGQFVAFLVAAIVCLVSIPVAFVFWPLAIVLWLFALCIGAFVGRKKIIVVRGKGGCDV
jgi:hypothetical protein